MGRPSQELREYVEGYISGQHDALTWLTVDASDDTPLAAFDERVQFRASMVCLAANLAAAAGLCAAFELGIRQHTHQKCHPKFCDKAWSPGCKLTAATIREGVGE